MSDVYESLAYRTLLQACADLRSERDAKDAEIERLRAELEEANITIRALVGASPVQEKP